MTYLYSLEDKELHELKEEPGTGAFVIWSIDGLRVAGTERRLWVWDSQTDQIVYNMNTTDTYSWYRSAFWSQDGNSLLSTLYHFNTRTSLIEMWDTTTGQVSPLEIPGAENPIVEDWSPDERFIAIVTTDHPDVGPIQIFELSSEQIIHTFTRAEVRPVAWDSSGTKFATSSASGDITVWDTKNWQSIVTLPSQGDFKYSVEWHPLGNYIAATGDGGVIIWNVNSAASTFVHDQRVSDVAWDREGERLATSIGDTKYVWDVALLP
jgi:WD40 repeat protein